MSNPYLKPSSLSRTLKPISLTHNSSLITRNSHHVIIIGAGFAGLSSACFLAKAGVRVTVLEKQPGPGGRAAQLKTAGFTFDMGPSWYWMPDVFDRFFGSFGKQTSGYYKLERLDPSYRIYWPKSGTNDEPDSPSHATGPRDDSTDSPDDATDSLDDATDSRNDATDHLQDYTDLPADLGQLKDLFESIEPGSSARLDKFLAEAAYKYRVGMQKLVYKPGLSIFEFADLEVMKGAFQLDLLTSMEKHVNHYFQHPRLREILKFPVLFLGALPKDTPALYSLMNYADIVGGTWYPDGGMYAVVDAMYQLALELGVDFNFNEAVTEITVEEKSVHEVLTRRNVYYADAVIGAADYHHIETQLLPSSCQSYSGQYWATRKMAPSCLLYYVGINKKISNLLHHSLFFDTDFERHATEIYEQPAWPTDPLFYVCASSVTDDAAAPPGHENLFFLIPVAAGMKDDTEAVRELYFQKILSRFEDRTGVSIKNSIVFKKSFAYADFVDRYNSFKGNAYGLANTLKQTAILKPSCKSKKIGNLFYAGQLTVPGPGVPPSLISGEIVAGEVVKFLKAVR
ncbi:phytoene desaturase family protein [Flavitalea antarctica]